MITKQVGRVTGKNKQLTLDFYFREARRHFISRLADVIKFVIDTELGTATAFTIQRHLKEKYGREYKLEDIDEAIELLADMYPDDYQKYRRRGHLGIRKLPNPEYPLPPEARKLVDELLTP